MTTNNLRDLKGTHFGTNPLRSAISSPDSGTVDGSTFKAASPKQIVYGAGKLFLNGALSASGTTMSVIVAYYDADDNYLCQSAVQALATSGIALENGDEVAEVKELDPLGAYAIRLYVTAVASGNVDLYLGYTDGFSR